MVEFLNDDVIFQGAARAEGEFIVNGGLTVGPGGLSIGASVTDDAHNWSGQVRVQVADTTERALLVAWRAANDPITALRPLLVWRANGSLTGVNEITVDGTNWYAESAMAGDVEMTLAADAPYGWLLCQGQTLADAATNYPALWAAADPVFRVGGALKLPDLRGRVPVGAGQGTSLTLRNLADQFGAETVALSEAQLASHTHSGATDDPDRSLNHNHTISGTEDGAALSGTTNKYLLESGSGGTSTGSVKDTTAPTATPSLKHKHTFTTGAAGSGSPHPNVQPSLALNFKVKV